VLGGAAPVPVLGPGGAAPARFHCPRTAWRGEAGPVPGAAAVQQRPCPAPSRSCWRAWPEQRRIAAGRTDYGSPGVAGQASVDRAELLPRLARAPPLGPAELLPAVLGGAAARAGPGGAAPCSPGRRGAAGRARPGGAAPPRLGLAELLVRARHRRGAGPALGTAATSTRPGSADAWRRAAWPRDLGWLPGSAPEIAVS
jgi:hypothetical protein